MGPFRKGLLEVPGKCGEGKRQSFTDADSSGVSTSREGRQQGRPGAGHPMKEHLQGTEPGLWGLQILRSGLGRKQDFSLGPLWGHIRRQLATQIHGLL